MEQVYVTRAIPQPALALLEEHFEVISSEGDPPDRAEVAERLADVRGVLALLTEELDEEALAHAPRLEVIANMAVGYDNIDVDAASERGILVTNTPGVLTETTADLTFALILATARRLIEGDQYLRAGRYQAWGPMLLMGPDVHGKKLGILGMGRIGEAVARRGALGFGMEILYHSRSRKPEIEEELGAVYHPADALFVESDFISIHLPLTEDTHHFVGPDELALMNERTILVNTARGPIVDETALVRALSTGQLGGVGLDVFENEPEVHPGLMELNNVVLLPHIGSASVETRTRMATTAARNLIAGLAGKRPPNLVNPDVWEQRQAQGD